MFAELRRRIVIAIAIVFVCAICSTASMGASFDGVRRQTSVQGDATRGAAKAAVCAACHGPQGVAVAPVFPNLAGQSQTYLYVQLRAFKQGARGNAVMKPLAGALSDRDMRDVAAYYASLPVKTAASNAQSSSRGDALFHDGDPQKGIPPCQGCHGRDGLGPRPDIASGAPQPAWATFPKLAGQNSPYVLEQLKAFREGGRAGTSNAMIMRGIAGTLDEADRQALAAYIASQ